MTDRELMQQALEAFGGLLTFNPSPAEYKQGRDVVAALRERLAQPEQEPVAWYDKHGMVTHDPFEGIRPLYAAPRPWVGLMDEEVQKIMEKTVAKCTELDDLTGDTARLTWKNCEAKLREKNGG